LETEGFCFGDVEAVVDEDELHFGGVGGVGTDEYVSRVGITVDPAELEDLRLT